MEKLIILTTIYNCEKYLARCLDSIIAQSYTDWVCYLLNDLSTDGSQKIAEDYVKQDSRFILINNTKKYYQPGNYDQVLRSDDIDDESIVVEVDGDDYLGARDSLAKVYTLHKQGYWITHGSFYYTDGRVGFSKPFDVSSLRITSNNATHLRSWRAKLWKNIDKEDLMFEGWYASTAGDVFFMLPMLEMAGDDRIKHINLPLYVYNEQNPINDHKVDMGKQWLLARVARKNKKYSKML